MASEPSQVESFPVTGVRCSAIAAGVRYADRLVRVEERRTLADALRNLALLELQEGQPDKAKSLAIEPDSATFRTQEFRR